MKPFDLETPAAPDPGRLRWPRRWEVSGDEAAPAGNQHYQDLTAASWADVFRVLEVEAALVRRLEDALDPSGEASRVEAELDGQRDDDDETPLRGLDLGVASAVLVLAAAGAVPVASCNGGAFGGVHMGANPYVACYIRPRRFLTVSGWAVRAGLLQIVTEDGVLVLHARQVKDFLRFAELALTDQALPVDRA